MRKLASIQKIKSLTPIEGADKIEKATILGWQVVVEKNKFKVGDLCVYCEIDSLMPDRPEFEFLRARGMRIRTVRLRGQVSQGICFPLSILNNLEDRSEEMVVGSNAQGELQIGSYDNATRIVEDMDVTEVLGITKFIVDLNDPLRKTLFPHYHWNEADNEAFDKLYQSHKEGYYTPWLDKVKDEEQCIKEMYEGLVFVDFVPTSENLSKWLFDIVSEKMKKIGVKVSKVQFDETPKSSSVYSV